MSPPKSCVDEIDDFWTDEQVIACLRSIERGSAGAPLPPNVVADVNPFLLEPSNLPEGIWYVVYSEDPKQAKEGIWKAKGDPCRIYSDSSIVGWRATLEFYKGDSSDGHRTNWVMQEYSITEDIMNKVKGASSLCRVFLSEREGETKPNDGDKGQISLLHDKDSKCEPLKSKPHEELEKYQAMLSNQEYNLLHDEYDECFAKGDFLELDDLNHNSSSSSSVNSSCVTPCSDLFFDSAALLQELKDEKFNQPKSSSYKLSVTRPNDTVVVAVAAEESTISGNDRSLEPVKVEASNDAGASSSRRAPGGDKGKKVYLPPKRGKKDCHGKSIKKFFCFMSF